jgi:hypothetical protein
MHDSGGARVAVFGILRTSAVAIFLSCSDATDLSDLPLLTSLVNFGVQYFLLRAPFSETT